MSERNTSRSDAEYKEERPRKEGQPPQSVRVPKGAGGSTRTGKTATDPATGEPTGERGKPPGWERNG